MTPGKFTDEDKKKLYKFLKSKGFLSDEDIKKYDAKYGSDEKSAAFKQGFIDEMKKMATAQPEPWEGGPYMEQLRSTAREGFEPFMKHLGRAFGPGPLIGNYDAWDSATDSAIESTANKSGIPDYGPLLRTFGAIGGMDTKSDDFDDVVSEANAAAVSPERWAAMTGAGTGPAAR